MRKNSPPPSGNKPGPKNSFKKTDSKRGSGDSRPFKKSDDRKRAPGKSDDRPFRKDKPAFDRTGGGEDRPAKRGAWKDAGDKPSFKKRDDDRPARSFDKKKPWEEGKGDGERKYAKRDSDKGSFRGERSERPARSFDKKKPWEEGKGDGERKFTKRDSDKGSFRGERSERPARSFDKKPWEEGKGDGERKFAKRDSDKGSFRGERSERPARAFDKKKPWEEGKDAGERKFRKTDTDRGPVRERKFERDADRGDRPARPFDKKKPWENKEGEGDRERKPKKEFDRPHKEHGDTRPFRERPKPEFAKPFRKKREEGEPQSEPLDKNGQKLKNNVKTYLEKKAKDTDKKDTDKKATPGKERKRKYQEEEEEENDEAAQSAGEEQMPLNKYIAHSGECSRRDAADMVKQGKVKVNGELVLDPGYKVKEADLVTLGGKKLKPTKGMVYILLNKPKGYITTNDDPQGRKTVMELVASSGVDKLFPVGRLDRATSGLLLMTNDGDLTQKLSHPSYNIKKVYHVTLDKPLTKAHFEKIAAGVELEDGLAQVDELAYLETKNELGLEIHSGRNRIVRRIFESLGYVVEKLDRVMYAGLTKKNLPRGKWRLLDPREIVLLKHFKS